MTSKSCISRNAPSIDITAIRYLRFIIASYILAVSFGITNGFDANAYFSGFLSHPTSMYFSKVFVVFCALMLIFGYFLRIVSLCLSIVILSSSVHLNLMSPVQGSLDAFWIDIVLVCSLLACYCPLSARQLRKQAMVTNGPKLGVQKVSPTKKVVPRRVTTSAKKHLKQQYLPILTQKLASVATPEEQQDVLMNRLSKLLSQSETMDGEVRNIFA